jgi:hypothetical protein
MNMLKHLRRLRAYYAWKRSRSPLLWNEDTGELMRWQGLSELPSGRWWFKRPLTLAGSTRMLFLRFRLTDKEAENKLIS